LLLDRFIAIHIVRVERDLDDLDIGAAAWEGAVDALDDELSFDQDDDVNPSSV